MEGFTMADWVAFKKWQYWLHRRIRCAMAFHWSYTHQDETAIDAGYCLDRCDTNV